MTRFLSVIAVFCLIVLFVLALTGCGEAREFPACQNHGGVESIGEDATNSNVPVACKDGTVVRVPM